jgi:hypothetical protein
MIFTVVWKKTAEDALADLGCATRANGQLLPTRLIKLTHSFGLIHNQKVTFTPKKQESFKFRRWESLSRFLNQIVWFGF